MYLFVLKKMTTLRPCYYFSCTRVKRLKKGAKVSSFTFTDKDFIPVASASLSKVE